MALWLQLKSNKQSACAVTPQVHRALETGDLKAVMALKEQLETVVSSKREQEGELLARLQVSSLALTGFELKSSAPVPCCLSTSGTGQSWSRVSCAGDCLPLKACSLWQAGC